MIKNSIERLVEEADNLSGFYSSLRSNSELILSKLENGGIGVVQGPPGTGKTTTLLSSTLKYFEKEQGRDYKDTTFIVAPTNALVGDIFKRLIVYFKGKGYDIEELLKKGHIKVWGSQYSVATGKYRNVIKKNIDRDTWFVVTTNYQVGYPEVSDESNRINIMMDEATVSTIYHPFTPIVNSLILAPDTERIVKSFVVVGDPMQTISFGLAESREEANRIMVLLNALRGLLQYHHGVSLDDLSTATDILRYAREHLRGDFYEMLNTTFRLPRPTEQPISEGFYFGELRSGKEYNNISELFDDDRVARLINSYNRVEGRIYRVIRDTALAINREIPIIYLQITKYSGMDQPYELSAEIGLNFDPVYAYLALIEACVLAYLSKPGVTVTVVTPYVDMKVYMEAVILPDVLKRCIEKYELISSNNRVNSLSERIKIRTVHTFLGGESEIVVAVLGKEWSDTFYFNHPEVFNVQMSRHKNMLVVVGNLARIYKNARNKVERGDESAKMLMNTIEAFMDIGGLEYRGNPLKLEYSPHVIDSTFVDVIDVGD